MKTLILPVMTLLFSMNIQAQNTNTQIETVTTTSTKKDSDGEHKTVKKEVKKGIQKVELGEQKENTINIPTIQSPVNVTTTTKITNPDGSTRTVDVDVDRSSYYESNGNKYKLVLDASGYIMTYGNSKPALLRKTSTNSYIFRSENKTAIGYFDTKGDLILEIYDDKSDKVSVEKYRAIKE